jgi:aspartate/methionine/tyrosine aminotransferase
MNQRLAQLSDYPFRRLDLLLQGLSPAPADDPRFPAALDPHPLALSLGEPQTPTPPMVPEILSREAALWGRYPPTDGTPAFRAAVADWLTRRFGLPAGLLDPDSQVTPCPGTREGLFFAGLAALPVETDPPALALMPNPFYHAYFSSSTLGGAEPVLLEADPQTGAPADLAALDRGTLARTAIAFHCTPSNPQGGCATLDQLCAAVEAAREHDFVLAVDECYCEIYRDTPPAGALAACAALHRPGSGTDPFANVLVFHSLSKRSGVPGLRSGFVAGDAGLIAGLRKLIAWGGVAQPLPVLAAATALWRDEAHVSANRVRYQACMQAAERRLAGLPGFRVPPAGFFLWLPVEDGEAAAKRLWQEAGIKAMPGAFMARPRADGSNPGSGFLRFALVHEPAVIDAALARVALVLGEGTAAPAAPGVVMAQEA